MKRLSRQLLEKSQEAFLLSLEIYNKPTVKYRIESFSIFFCNAWELLLKAYILEHTKKEKSIFYPKERDKPKRSIALRDAIKKIFPNENNPVRRNIEDIVDLRDSATHLIIKELEAVYVGLFQAGVLNYVETLKAWFGINVIDKISPAMLSLIFDIGLVNPVILRKKHGKEIADFFLKKECEIKNSTTSLSNKQYNVSIEYKLALVKNPKNADITLSSGSEGKASGVILHVAKDPSLIYPHKQVDCIKDIKEKIAKEIVFNSYDFQSILYKENMKGNSKYHYYYNAFGNNSYSPELVEFIIRKIQANPNYLSNARAWFKNYLAEKRRNRNVKK